MEKEKQFALLRETILSWNEKINVTAIRDPLEFDQKNIRDSLSAAILPEYEAAKTVIDIGTGGGFPGLPLAIESPEKEFVLTDAIGKKLKVVEEAIKALGLENARTVHARAEDLAREKGYRERFDLAVSRAVASMATLCEYCLPFVRVGGYFIAYKTADAKDEIAQAAGAIEKLGGKLIRLEAAAVPAGLGAAGQGESALKLPEDAQNGYKEAETSHLFAIVQKVKPTPAAYPRKAGTPKKEPLS